MILRNEMISCADLKKEVFLKESDFLSGAHSKC